MNWIVISIGTALVLALFTALLGPFFVDWTAYRGTIEANAERFLGTSVTIGGEAELRLLPNPRIRLTDVRLGGADNPIMTARAVELDVELTPLLRREFHVSELRVEGPVATVTLEEDGTLALPDITIDRRFASIFDVESVRVANIGLSAGELHIRDRRSGGDAAFTDIALTGDVRTLRGPFSAAGTLRIGGVEQRVQIGGGRLEAGTMPVSLRLVPEGSDLSLGFEGAVVPRPDALAMRGKLTMVSTGRPAWSLRGDLRANPSSVTLSRGTARYGAGDAAIELVAEGRYGIADGEPLSLALAARQLDLDRLDRALRAEAGVVDAPGLASAARPPRDWLDALAAYLSPALAAMGGRGGLDLPVATELDIGMVVAGGALIRDVSAAFASTGDGVRLERAEALLPGDTTVELTGRIGDGFVGNVSVSASQPSVLGRWWTGETVAGGTMNPVFAEADIEAAADAVAVRRLSLRIGQSSASGQANYQARGADRAQLDVALNARRLALADLADAWAVLGAAGWQPAALPDVRIDLGADEVLFGGTAGAALSLDADFRDGMLTIDALSAQDIAGVKLFASGAIGDLFGAPVGAIEGTLAIEDGERLAAALGGVEGDSAVVAQLAAAAPALAPADARFRLSGGTGSDVDGLSLAVSGTAADTSLEIDAALTPGPNWREEPARLSVSARNADAARLLGQLGLDVTGTQPEGTVELAFAGTPAEGMDGSANFDLLGIEGRFAGALRVAEGVAPTGTLSLEAQSLAPLGTALALDLPALAPLILSGKLDDGANGLRLDEIEGSAAGTALSGALASDGTGVAGTLRLEALNLGALTALLLGSDPLSSGADGQRFANTVFPVQLAAVLPPLAIEFETEALAFGSLDLGEAALGLALSADRLAVSDLRAQLAGGALSGDFTLTREGARSALTGELSLEDAALDALVWRQDGTPVATGRLAASGTFEGAGFTPSGLMSDLSGDGRYTLTDVRIAGLNPAPLDLGADAFVGEAAPSDDVVRAALADHLAAGTLAIGHAEGALDLNGGTLRAGETVLPATGGTELRASGAVDIVSGTLEGDVAMTFARQESQEAFSVGLAFAGPIGAPQRQIDIAAVTAYLNLRRLEQQVQAVEEQNQALEAEANRYAPTLPGQPVAEPEATPAPEPDAAPSDAPPTDSSATEPAPTDASPNSDAAEAVPVPLPAPPSSLDRDARLEGSPGTGLARNAGDQPTVRDELLRALGVDPATVSPGVTPQQALSP